MPGDIIAGATNMAPGPKKESFMPPAVWVPAAAGVVGGIFQSHGQSQANRAQQQANQQAQSLERERMAEDKRRYDQQYEAQMAQRRLRDQVARQILSQHGINVPDAAAAAAQGKSGTYKGTQPSLASLSPGMSPPGAPTGSTPAMGPGAASQMFDSQAGTPSTLMSAPTAPAAPQPGMAPPSMAGLTNWSDELWRKQ